jgi:hypothetical protein
VQLSREKPGIGNIKGLNLAAGRSTVVQFSNCRFAGLNNLRHYLLYNTASREISVYIRIWCHFLYSVYNVHIPSLVAVGVR